jgi:ribonuclease HII
MNNKGYGTKAHLEALREHGLTEYHRKSFCKKFI